MSPDLVEYGTSWSPRCRAITVTWSENAALELRGPPARPVPSSLGTVCLIGKRVRRPEPSLSLSLHTSAWGAAAPGVPTKLLHLQPHEGPWAGAGSGLGVECTRQGLQCESKCVEQKLGVSGEGTTCDRENSHYASL